MATVYTQANRPLRVATPLGGDKFLLAGIQGSEAVSSPFEFQLDLRSLDASVNGAALLRKPITVTLLSDDGSSRYIHGLVKRFVQLGQRDDLSSYSAEIVPWLWFLSLSRNCRIFQDQSVLDIVQEVFKGNGFTDFRSDCTGSYAKREYCVQYRETDLDFVSRLLQEEGIFYFFEHTSGKHTLVLADGNGSFKAAASLKKARVLAPGATALEAGVLSLAREDAVHPGKVILKDYDFEKPSSNLESTAPGQGPEEVYDYPGGYSERTDGDHYSRLRIEAEEALQHVVSGESTCRGMQAGSRFDLESHFRSDANASYVVLELTLGATMGGFRGWDEAEEFNYRNHFVAIPVKTPFRPRLQTPRPVIAGTQTAVVVGKTGEEIWTDKYGRVKLQFHWDRGGKKDEKSSCWVRVASGWAGKQWGEVQIPRIGQEVVVAFLEGDPDRPLVVGSVYNAELMPPYALPGEQTKSGVKSRSSKGGQPDNFNEIRLEDKKGSEQINVQAEKDLSTLVKNDETRSVGHDRSTTVKNNETRTVTEGDDVTTISKGNQTNTVSKGDQTIEVTEGKQTVTVRKDQTIEVKDGNQSVTVGKGNQTVTVSSGDQVLTVTKGKRTVHLKAGDHERLLDKGNDTLVIKMGNREVTLSMGNLTTKLKLGKVKYEAMQGIELKVGQNSIKIDQTGVTIKGMMVKIEGQAMTEVKGLMTQIKGDTLLKAGGALTMIGG